MTSTASRPVSAPTDTALVLSDIDERGVCTLTLNRPRQYNALSNAMLNALASELETLAAHSGLRCVVLAARGKAFCAGHDLKELRASDDREQHQATFARCSRVMQQIVALPVPVIARVHGLATAAGCQLVASCDLAVASDNARFAVSGINAGLFCSTPAVALSRNIATKRAFEMLVTGEFIDADTALDWGLINRSTTADALDDEIADLVEQICTKSGFALRRGKALFYRQLNAPLADAYDDASEAITCDLQSADAREGIDAFIAKRKPQWQDR